MKIHGRDVNHLQCSTVEASKFVGDFWNIWIIRQLLTGPKRFSELLEAMPTINKVTLTNKLKILIEASIVEKVVQTVLPLVVHYELSSKGKDLQPLIRELETFGERHFSDVSDDQTSEA